MVSKMKKIGIIGHGADKFTIDSMQAAMAIIENIFEEADITLVSGHSPVGGIDIWAEETARSFGIPCDIKTPKQHKWDSAYGYKQRNIDIAKDSDELHVILVDISF